MTKSSEEFAEKFPSPPSISPTIKLYDSNTITTLPWPDSEVAQLAKKYWLPLMQSRVSQYIDNIETQLFALTIDDLV
ncbi:MAG: hypothetical protein WCA35_24710, partial [Kovacikia sp.]